MDAGKIAAADRHHDHFGIVAIVPGAATDAKRCNDLWTERVYSARGMSNDFWCHFYRLMVFETRSDEAVSLGYVRKAIPLLADRLNSESEAGPTMEALYLLGEYNRRLGNAADADRYLAQLTSFEASGEMSGFKAYLLEIAGEQRNPPADNPPEQTREQ